MDKIVVFYNFVHFLGKMHFVAEPHPIILFKFVKGIYGIKQRKLKLIMYQERA
ncbi:hypothetical protein Hanom_Chr03g00264931 [Helianthus anomalus]